MNEMRQFIKHQSTDHCNDIYPQFLNVKLKKKWPACPRWGIVHTTPVAAVAIANPLVNSCSKTKRET